MMKMILMMLFMIPLMVWCNFWMVQWMFLLMSLIFLLNFSFNYMLMNISYFLGIDLLSFTLILLSFWICSLMILASQKIYKMKNYSEFFSLIMLILMFSLFILFSSMNFFIFYLFFEISLIPTLILIIGWGYQPERIEAGSYLLFYTLLVSLPMMISIFYLYKFIGSMDFYFFKIDLDNMFMFYCMNFVFFVKIPMFFVHLWLPKAHVEAPVSGSMILAGIMLKLGGYGLLRVMPLYMSVIFKISYIFISISLVGGFFISLICLRQSDIKSLIAYSSVSHMGLVLSSIFTLNYWGLTGALVMMLAHGLCSSGLFCLANISYERMHSRSLYLSKGMINIMPSMSFWWFMFSCGNMASPPSMNLLGEIMMINSLVSYSWMSMIFLSLSSFFGAAYSLYLYSYSQHGKFYSGLFCFYMGYIREFLLLFLHLFPLNVLIMKSEYFSLWL
uniref:NADH-ubiquinone oxidoreductase chain 4 n=1 Tax=Micrambe villosus TaxID=1588241 RepID=A0A343C3A9_9CUCU|nr:NADH dehydrogenase subunit 4 [Micrambe villosus]